MAIFFSCDKKVLEKISRVLALSYKLQALLGFKPFVQRVKAHKFYALSWINLFFHQVKQNVGFQKHGKHTSFYPLPSFLIWIASHFAKLSPGLLHAKQDILLWSLGFKVSVPSVNVLIHHNDLDVVQCVLVAGNFKVREFEVNGNPFAISLCLCLSLKPKTKT